jgi:hypothetical protein
MIEDQYTDDADVSKLEQRIEDLEETIRKMLPGRRDALKLGGTAVLGAAAMSGTASAGSSQVGTIGSAGNLVDVKAEDIDVSDTLTTQDIVVNGTATGPFGGGGIVLESGDSITVARVSFSALDTTHEVLYSGPAKDVLGGVISGSLGTNWYYEFSDGTILNKNGSGTSYSFGNDNQSADQDGSRQEIDFLPPAKDVVKIEVGDNQGGSSRMGVEVLLKD